MAVHCRPPCPAPLTAQAGVREEFQGLGSTCWVSRRRKLNFSDSVRIRMLLRAVIPSPSLGLARPGPCEEPGFKLQLSGAAQRKGLEPGAPAAPAPQSPPVPVSPCPGAAPYPSALAFQGSSTPGSLCPVLPSSSCSHVLISPQARLQQHP